MKILVAFYSRTGVTRKTAEALAAKLSGLGHDVATEEIIDKKKRAGFFGWLSAGRDAVRKKSADIEPTKADVSAFDMVVTGTPVWAWTMTPAVRAFLTAQKEKIRDFACFATMEGSGDKRSAEAVAECMGRQPVASAGFLAKHVKKEDPEGFTAPLEKFARDIVGGKPSETT